MAPIISLGKCNDISVPKLAQIYKKRLQAGKAWSDEVYNIGNKRYEFRGDPDVVFTETKNTIGKVRKTYLLRSDGEYHLQARDVSNARGEYSRSAYDNGECVWLGADCDAYIRQQDGTYIRERTGKRASSEEIEAAIDYIKGKGSEKNYKKLLRNYVEEQEPKRQFSMWEWDED